ncbi:MAG: OsmC family protein [Flavobacteriales bacterium]|nr:OsmC family protein [Flavobacteriales bacterium]
MSHTSEIIYLGELRTEARHVKSSQKIITDAPTDNNGKGAAFSPTDLLATSLGSCMLTIMGIVAERNNIPLKNAKVRVTKIMGTEPRRVTEIHVEFTFSDTYSDKEKKLLENAAKTCPAAYSLHPDIKQEITFLYTPITSEM